MNFLKTFLAGLLAFFVGSLLVVFLWIVVLLGIAGSMEKSVAVYPSSILKIDFSETLTDSPSTDPLGAIDLVTMRTTHKLPIFKAIRAIEAARDDDRIEGIYLRMNGTGGVEGMALLEELREAVDEFKQSGKFVVSYNETYSQGQYYFASVADSIYMQPEGGMEWAGLAMNVMFYKGLFDKLDLRAEIFRPTACKYKSAVEPFIMDRMSPANREQSQELVRSLWNTVTRTVSDARGIEPAVLNRLADELSVALPEEALAHGFVDGLRYEDQMNDVFARFGVEPDSDGEYRFISLGDYASQVGADLKNLSSDEVAVVYADGAIVDGEGTGKEVYGNTLAATLSELRSDEKVAAVVLRVNSPGGSALASDVIWREMELLRAEKPVVVSMGSYAASGGYYISCPADVIVADRMTLTGSIGVFGMFIDTREALKNKLGITVDGVKTNASADFAATAPLTPLQRAMIMRGVDRVYDTFTSYVAEGRNLPIEKVLEIAGGRVWTGEEALDIGLIDTYGGLKTAIAMAVDKAALGEKYRVREVVEAPTGFAAFLSSLNVSVREAFTRSSLGLMMEQYEQVREAASQQGVVMYSPCRYEIR